MVCGKPLQYASRNEIRACMYCREESPANAWCVKGHFVCDRCHSASAADIIERACIENTRRDMLPLLARLRSHSAIPVHGPEHHAMVAAIILSACRNSGCEISVEAIRTGIQRGLRVAGGSCGFSGVCGAASGVGIAFSLILGANPVKGREKKLVQSAVLEVMRRLAEREAPRCCLRASTDALQCAADISEKYLPVTLHAGTPAPCRQQSDNRECIGRACPLHTTAAGKQQS